jgi:DNA helicase II / ATP-dependent DNA helicase PcrA
MAWREARRISIDAATLARPTDLLNELLPLWLARQRVTLELSVPFDKPDEIDSTAPWMLAPTFTFVRERLWHVMWSNSVDGRETPRWHWDEVAASIDPNAPLDGDGTYYDGGPLGRVDGIEVVHRIALERGSLARLGHAPPAADLAPDQLAAVGHPGATARIIAPAGSGKTRVLTERARHLLRDWNLPASAVTLVAFNVRAADEIRQRVGDLGGLQIRTLNALALNIVQRVAGRSVTTVDERDVRRIIDSLVTFPRKTNTDPAQAWIDAFSLTRLGLRNPAEVEALFDGEVDGFAEVFPKFRAILSERNQVDFDEQIVLALQLMLTDPDVREEARRSARVLLVDEFQDLTPAHLLLLRLLASPDLAVFGVGDDDQTIYGYSGATPDWLIEFAALFPGAADHPLQVNYRCPAAVVTAASTLLTHNRRRVDKVIEAGPHARPEAEALTVHCGDDPVDTTVKEVRQAVGGGTSPADIAVLTRVNAALAPVQVALRHAGVAVTAAVDGRYLERSGVRSVLAWIRVAQHPDNLKTTDIDATIRRPSRGLSGRVVEWAAECKSVAALYRLADRLTTERDADKVRAYAADIEELARRSSAGATTAELLAVVRTRVGLEAALAKLDRSRADANSSHVDDLDSLTSLATLHPEPSTFAEWLRSELSQPGDPTGVMLATIHRVKGREWPFVVVHDVRDGVLPHRLAADLEEERRLFHVGITRASRQCTVVADARVSSPFIAELSERYVAPPPRAGRTAASTPVTSLPKPALEFDGDLRERLRAWRKQQADFDAVPAYVVFSNATLDALAAAAPGSVAELAGIPGIGPVKREKYGNEVVAIVGEWRAASG